MQIQIHTDDNIQGGESLAQWAQREAADKLARFREHLTRVEVFFSDVDAGKSGGKRCRIEARPAGRQPVSVSADADKLADAFTGAQDKLVRALDTDIGRVKDKKGRDTIRTAQP